MCFNRNVTFLECTHSETCINSPTRLPPVSSCGLSASVLNMSAVLDCLISTAIDTYINWWKQQIITSASHQIQFSSTADLSRFRPAVKFLALVAKSSYLLTMLLHQAGFCWLSIRPMECHSNTTQLSSNAGEHHVRSAPRYQWSPSAPQ